MLAVEFRFIHYETSVEKTKHFYLAKIILWLKATAFADEVLEWNVYRGNFLPSVYHGGGVDWKY